MTNYGMALIIEGREVSLPVLPAKLKVTSPGKNETTTVLELGEILRLRKKGLRTVAWDCFFPVHDAPYVTGQIRDPVEIVQAIQAARDTLTPIRLLITGTVAPALGMEGLVPPENRPSGRAEEAGEGEGA